MRLVGAASGRPHLVDTFRWNVCGDAPPGRLYLSAVIDHRYTKSRKIERRILRYTSSFPQPPVPST